MIKILTTDELLEWDKFVFNHKYGTIYHTSDWFRIIEKSFHAKLFVFVKKEKSLVAGIPFFLHNSIVTGSKLSSITSAQYCNPLVSNKEDFNELLVFIKSYTADQRIKQIELKTNEDFEYVDNTLLTPESDFCTFTLSLEQSYDQLEKSFHKSCILRPLKKAYKNELKLIYGSSLEDVKIFYRFYETMRKDNGLLPQPFSFFKNVWDQLFDKRACEILHAEYNGKIISSVFNLMYKGTYTYEYGATDSKFINIHPSHFLLDNSIKIAISKNYKTFDFGRTENSNEGLMDFKRRWGSKKVNLNYFYLPPNEGKSLLDNKLFHILMEKTINITPKPIYREAGKLAYRILF